MSDASGGDERGSAGARSGGTRTPSLVDELGASIAPPSLTLPTGGSVRGMGETYRANPMTGTGTLRVPLPSSPARGGFVPELTLEYDSGAGNGPFGLGWRLEVPAITRRTDKGVPTYDDDHESDDFMLSSADVLVPVLGPDGRREVIERTVDDVPFRIHRYRPRIDELHARIERWANVDSGECHWRTISRTNVTTLFGTRPDARIASDPDGGGRVYSWLATETYDDRGNAARFDHLVEDSAGVTPGIGGEANRDDDVRRRARYVGSVRYGNVESRLQVDGEAMSWRFQLCFDYGQHADTDPKPDDALPWSTRLDPISVGRAGFEIRSYRLCRRVLLFHHFPDEPSVGTDRLVRSLAFEYAGDPERGDRTGSFLRSATQRGHGRDDAGAVTTFSFPPLEFERIEPWLVADASPPSVHRLDPPPIGPVSHGVGPVGPQWVDLDGDSVPGILTVTQGAWWFARSLGGGRFASPRQLEFTPAGMATDATTVQLLDLDGDGRVEVVDLGGPGRTAGSWARDRSGWASFQPFRSVPLEVWDDPEVRLIDLTGDGLLDLLRTSDSGLTWFPSLGSDGFGPPQRLPPAADDRVGPRVLFSDPDDSVHLGDMTGDGLADLVRIRNTEVTYWQNLGHGRFGPAVVMDGSPRFGPDELFDARRVILADVDGSGPADLLYLDGTEATVWRNLFGNGWAPPRSLPFPPVAADTVVSVFDLLGRGTACLVWYSPTADGGNGELRYVDLMGGRRPNLLSRVRNHLGSTTEIVYESSTTFFLADAARGSPWCTRLPFPVHVVERVVVEDHVARSRTVTRYEYHHGHYDGDEREFRGFGRVDQFDTEEFIALPVAAPGGEPDGPDPPARTPTGAATSRTTSWFHPGVLVGADEIEAAFAREYHREPGSSDGDHALQRVGRSVIPPDLSAGERREACRALKGALLRDEVYGHDGGARELLPYIAGEHSYEVRLGQRRGVNRHAVFSTVPRETVQWHYERALVRSGPEPDAPVVTDPRVTHEAVLEVSPEGVVLSSVQVAYPRRVVPADVPAAAAAAQRSTLARFRSHRVTTDVIDSDSDHRVPALWRVDEHAVLGLVAPASPRLFTFESLAAIAAAPEVGPGDDLPEGVSRRAVGRATARFRSDDLASVLPAGEQGRRSLVDRTYALGLPSAVRTDVFGDDLSDADLVAAGYVDLDGDGSWWCPSSRTRFSTADDGGEAASIAANELAEAVDHCFLPVRWIDAHDNVTTATFDHDLLVGEIIDPAGQRITAGERDSNQVRTSSSNDFVHLQPMAVTDANFNRSEVLVDTRGLVVATANCGKPAEATGDTVAGLAADLAESAAIAAVADPDAADALLGSATTRIVYDLGAYERSRSTASPQPCSTLVLRRATHVADPKQLETTAAVSYCDGQARALQGKVRVADGALDDLDGPILPRWLVSNAVVLDRKGRPVREFAPRFSATPTFDQPEEQGPSTIVCYDPVDRPVVTVRADHTFDKTVFDAWSSGSYDAGDTVLISDPRADSDVGGVAAHLTDADVLPSWHAVRSSGAMGLVEERTALAAELYADTPSRSYLDPLGRKVAGKDLLVTYSPTDEVEIVSSVVLDDAGRLAEVVDGAGRVAERFRYDFSGNEVSSATIDGGARRAFHDVDGRLLVQWDDRGHRTATTYDELRRPVSVRVQSAAFDSVVEVTEYGSDAAANDCGRVRRVLDQAGATEFGYDVSGNPTTVTQRLANRRPGPPDWRPLDCTSPDHATGDVVTIVTEFDALGRPRSVEHPNDAGLVTYRRGRGGELLGVDLAIGGAAPDPIVVRALYDAEGRRRLVEYGNGTVASFSYDAASKRLQRAVTQRSATAYPGDVIAGVTAPGSAQQLTYAYDPMGNIVSIVDDALPTVFFRNKVVRGDVGYRYDSLYRLVEARGREHVGLQANGGRRPATPGSPTDSARVGLVHRADETAVARYVERYELDAVGNLLSVVHQGADPQAPGWTRTYAYAEPSPFGPPDVVSNRLSSTTVGTVTEPHGYDEHGNMASMSHLTLVRWDHRDQLQATARQLVAGGPGETTSYVYGASGERVRKVTDAPGGGWTEQVYVGSYERHRSHDAAGNVLSEHRTVHVMGGTERIAIIEIDVTGGAAVVVRYQHSNHLGSAVLELDAVGEVISYEEYHPYGTTAFQSARANAPPKRYRFCGKERDEESGLGYHGARYYAPWLGRWTSCDPAGDVNGYLYCRANPVSLFDPDGAEGRSWVSIGVGLLQIGGGALEIAAGIGLEALPTGVSQVLGVVALVHGADTVATGLATLITGEVQQTNTQRAAAGVAKGLGASDTTAERIGTGVDIVAGVGPSIGIGIAKKGAEKALVKSAEVIAEEGASHAAPTGVKAVKDTATATGKEVAKDASTELAKDGAKAAGTGETAVGKSAVSAPKPPAPKAPPKLTPAQKEAVKKFEQLEESTKSAANAGRPADSAWRLAFKERGLALEKKALALLGRKELPANFKTFDSFVDGVATSVKSVDLGAATYQKASALRGALRGYIREIQAFTEYVLGKVSVSAEHITSRELVIVLEPGRMSAMQKAVLDEIVKFGADNNILVKILEMH